MTNYKLPFFIFFAVTLTTAFAVPVFATTYSPGVSVGQYAKYGNFVGDGPGAEAFNNYDWLKLQVTGVTENTVTLFSTGQFKDGTPTPGNGSTTVWNVETGTEDGTPRPQGPIIAANLNQGDAIPPPNTYTVNRTESRVYLGISRTADILEVSFSTSGYNSSLTYVYDRASGILLESTTQTTTQAEPAPVTTVVSYSVVETNIFGSSPTLSPTIPEFPLQTACVALLTVLIIAVSAIVFLKKRKQA